MQNELPNEMVQAADYLVLLDTLQVWKMPPVPC